MIQSMTGYGRATGTFNTVTISVELKSVNGKSLELNARIHSMFNEKETDIRKKIAEQLERGSVFVNIHRQDSSGNSFSINNTIVENYLTALQPVAKKFNQDESQLLAQLIRLPEVLQNNQQTVNEAEWTCLQTTLQQALEQLVGFRKQEGLALENDFDNNLKKISTCLEEVEKLAPQRYDKIKATLTKKITDLMESKDFDKNRLEQELIYYIERLDINEEVIRLKNHLAYFAKQLKDTKTSAKGKTLNFIGQEMGREINTIGSKANDAEMQQWVVKMKDELEKIKEQTMNVV